MKMRDWIRLWSLGGAVALWVLAAPVFGSSSGTTPEKRNSWTSYVWVPGYDGDAAIRGNPFDVDLSISDTLDALSDLNASFIGHYERIQDPWTFIVDVNFWQLEADAQTPNGRIEAEPESWIVELAGARTISRKELATPGRMATAQFLGGVRYSRLKLAIENTTTGAKVDGDQDWFDPFLGVRYFYDLDNRWTAGARFDFGGFGVGSDFTWNLVADFAYRFSRNRSLLIGWRILDQDYEDDGFVWNVQQSGPFLALSSRF
jgi:hypothetical protein